MTTPQPEMLVLEPDAASGFPNSPLPVLLYRQVIDASGIPVAGIDIHTFLGSDNVNSERTDEESIHFLLSRLPGPQRLGAGSWRISDAQRH